MLGAGLRLFRRFVWTACLALVQRRSMGLRSEVPIGSRPWSQVWAMIAAGGSQRRPYGPWISVGLLGLMFGGPLARGDSLPGAGRRIETSP